MIKTTTLNELVQYAYNEPDLIDSDRIQRSIDGDPLAKQEYDEVIGCMNLLNQAQLQPSNRSIDRILEFSRSYQA